MRPIEASLLPSKTYSVKQLKEEGPDCNEESVDAKIINISSMELGSAQLHNYDKSTSKADEISS